MNQNHGEALNALVGLRLLEIGRASDVLWMHFGSWRMVQNRTRDGTRTVGDWALHIQSPWRVIRDQTILLGERDLSRSFKTGKEFDMDVDGESRLDRIAQTLNKALVAQQHLVQSVSSDGVGGFSLNSKTTSHWRYSVSPLTTFHLVNYGGSLSPRATKIISSSKRSVPQQTNECFAIAS